MLERSPVLSGKALLHINGAKGETRTLTSYDTGT